MLWQPFAKFLRDDMIAVITGMREEELCQKTIYVADDEVNIRMLIQSFLVNEGYEVEVFSDGESLLQRFHAQPSDLVILDIMMPGLDGLNICAAIRQKSDVPIIIVSAKDSPLDRVTGITLGSDDYLVKPFLPLELVARAKALFRRAVMPKESSMACFRMRRSRQASSPRRACG